MKQSRALLSLAAISVLFVGMLPAQSFAFEDEIEIEVEIIDNVAIIDIETQDFEDEFVLDSTDEDAIIAAIMTRVDLSADQIRDIWKFESEHDEFEKDDHDDYYEDFEKEYDGIDYGYPDRDYDYDDDRDHDYEDDKYHDYDYDRKHDMKPEECIVEEDRDMLVVDEECIFNMFDEIPKEECIVTAEDGLIWYDRECVYENYDKKRDHERHCIVEEDGTVIVADEECLLQKYDEIPHADCARSEDGLVFFDKECASDDKYKRYHDGTGDSDSQRLIQELQEENRLLKEQIHELEQQIADLNQLLREQLRVIYEWITNR